MSQINNPPALLDDNKTPQQDAREHNRALFRGRGVLAAAIGLLLLFAAVMVLVAALDPLSLDVPITRAVQKLNAVPVLSDWLYDISWPGYAPYSYLFPLALVLLLVVLKRVTEAVFLLLAAVGTVTADIAKELVRRARPSDTLVSVVHNTNLDGSSFPSSHVVEYTLVFGFCFYLIFTLLKRGALRTLLLIVCGAMIVLIGPSRIIMGQHWASDVFGGYTLGFGVLLLVIAGYRAWEKAHVKQEQTASVSSPRRHGGTKVL